MNITKLAVLATVFLQDISAKNLLESDEGSYYNDMQEDDDTLDLATSLKSYSYSYYNYGYSYGYSYGYGYGGYNSTANNWAWFAIIFICIPIYICYRCNRSTQLEEGHHDVEHHDVHGNVVSDSYQNMNNTGAVGTVPVQVNYAPNPAMMTPGQYPQMAYDPNNPNAQMQQQPPMVYDPNA